MNQVSEIDTMKGVWDDSSKKVRRMLQMFKESIVLEEKSFEELSADDILSLIDQQEKGMSIDKIQRK